MVRVLFVLAALCWLGCGSDPEVLYLGDGGSGGSGPASGGSGGTDGAAEAGTGNTPAPPPESDVISVAEGDFNVGAPPPAAAEDPAQPQIVNITAPDAVTNGGSAILHVEVSPRVPSATFLVGLEGDTGYHTVSGTDPDGDGIIDLTVQVAAEASQASLQLSVALVDAQGNPGPYRQVAIALVQSGTGDVKITLSFDRLHDLDLHVIEPNGEEIQYTNPSSATGGELDLDSGAHCEASPANSENIFWPPGGAPAGTYRVQVYNYEQCSPGAIAFTVRVAYDNVVNTYTGTFADGSAGEEVTANNVIEVVTFTRGQ